MCNRLQLFVDHYQNVRQRTKKKLCLFLVLPNMRKSDNPMFICKEIVYTGEGSNKNNNNNNNDNTCKQ